jgi:hypothetical protein
MRRTMMADRCTHGLSTNPASGKQLCYICISPKDKPVRIIDRDIDFYEGEIERLQSELRRCLPSQEKRLSHLLDRVVHVRDALRRYKHDIDEPKAFED